MSDFYYTTFFLASFENILKSIIQQKSLQHYNMLKTELLKNTDTVLTIVS